MTIKERAERVKQAKERMDEQYRIPAEIREDLQKKRRKKVLQKKKPPAK